MFLKTKFLTIIFLINIYSNFIFTMEGSCFYEMFDSNLSLEEILKNHSLYSKDKYGNTILHKAVCFCNEDVVEDLLLDQKININAVNIMGDTAFHLSIYYKNFKIIKQFLGDSRLDVNLKNRLDESPVHLSIKLFETITLLKLLLKRDDIDIISKNRSGQDAIMIAKFLSKEQHLKLLYNYLIKTKKINYYIESEFEFLDNPKDYEVKIFHEPNLKEKDILVSSKYFQAINITKILCDIFPYLIIIEDYKSGN